MHLNEQHKDAGAGWYDSRGLIWGFDIPTWQIKRSAWVGHHNISYDDALF